MSSLYDLEQEIMHVWSITTDIDTISEAVVENDLSKDQIANMLIGLSQLYNLKFEKLFRTFDSACFPNSDGIIYSQEWTEDDQEDRTGVTMDLFNMQESANNVVK
jgi:hypothetical protein